MLRAGVNPEISTWEVVISQAEIAEIAENIATEPRGWSRQPRMQYMGPNRRYSNSYMLRNSWKNRFNRPFLRNNHISRFTNSPSQPTPNQATKDPLVSISAGPSTKGNPLDNKTHIDARRPNKTDNSHKPSAQKSKGNRTRLSEKEKAELIAAQKCFECKQPGHIACNCPNRSTVKSKDNQPPRMSNFSIDIASTERNSSPEVLDELSLSAITLETPQLYILELDSAWRESYPNWVQLSNRGGDNLADCYGMMLEYILTQCQPYPGDNYFEPLNTPYLRFEIHKQNEYMYLIRDLLVEHEFLIEKSNLEEPTFNVTAWMMQEREIHLGITATSVQLYYMGNPLVYVTTQLLTDAIQDYFPSIDPNLDPKSHFQVRSVDDDYPCYSIDDVDIGIRTYISKQWLTEPTFLLVPWYRQYLIFEHQYEERYFESQLELNYLHSEFDKDSLDLISVSSDDSHLEDLDEDCELSKDEEVEANKPFNFLKDAFAKRAWTILLNCQPYPGDENPENIIKYPGT